MELVSQKRGQRTCGQCCVAMILGITREEAIELTNKRKGTLWKHLKTALEKKGYSMSAPKQIRHIKGDIASYLPKTAIMRFRYQHPNKNNKLHHSYHWVVFHDGQIYCPDNGIIKINWNTIFKKNNTDGWVTSYHEIKKI